MKVKKVGDRELPAKCFAWVGDPEAPETWKLPYLNPDGSVDETHLAAAAAALSPGGFRGQKVDLPTEAVAGVKAKLRAAYGKLGKKGEEIPGQLREAEQIPPGPPLEKGGDLGEWGRLVEAVDDGGFEWLVCLIKAGLAKSGTFYPAEVLREAAPRFEGARGYDRSDQDHLADRGASVRNIVGWHDQVQFQEADGGRLTSHFHVAADAPWLAAKMRDAWAKGKKDLVGFSIVADGRASMRRQGGQVVRYAEAITKVDAVDPVLNPSAGGQIIRLIQADTAGGDACATGREGELEMLDKLIKLIEATRPELLQGKDVKNLKEDEIMTLFKEAMAQRSPGGDAGATDPAKAKEGDDLLKQVEARLAEAEKKAKEAEVRFQEAECRNLLATKLTASGLPEITQAKVKKAFGDKKVFTEAEVDQVITDEREYLAKFHEAKGGPGFGPATPGPAERDRVLKALDGFFWQQDLKLGDEKVPQFKSFKEAYIQITGDRFITGHFKEAVNLKRFTEALDTSSWAQILGDSVTRRMLAEYALPELQGYRQIISDITAIQDFRTNRRLRLGGYGELPAVAAQAAYTELTSPGDEEATYAISKRGGLETVTLEMVANDDVGAIRRIPVRLARAAARTLYEAIFGIFSANSGQGAALTLTGDTDYLFKSDNVHGNYATTALSLAALNAARYAMRSQAAFGNSAEILGLTPKLLLVPNEMEELAFKLCMGPMTLISAGTTESSDAPNLHRGLEYLVVDSWTDATNWYLVCNPKDCPTIELGFYQGREEPELFVQDQPNVGSMFAADKITYKIRHIWGYCILDYRGFQGRVVA